MPYINYDANGNITGQFACQQYEEQLYTDLEISNKLKVINGIVVDISNIDEYKNKKKKEKKDKNLKQYQQSLLQLKSEDELNQFLKSCGKITQAEYDSRLATITTDLTTLQTQYLEV